MSVFEPVSKVVKCDPCHGKYKYMKKSEWAERSEICANEIAAIEAASKILAKVGGVRTEAPSNPISAYSPVSFLQLSSASDDPKMKAVVHLRQQARRLHAKSLERLAQELSSHLGNPFAEVLTPEAWVRSQEQTVPS